MYAGRETEMDEANQDPENGNGLYTLGLACCIGISVCGTYSQQAQPGEIRHNAFLAHLADGPAMERTWKSLESKVDRAKKSGLMGLRIQVCVVDPSTLREDKEMRWSKDMVDGQRRINDVYISKAAGLRDGSLRSGVEVYRHHINDIVDMRITRDRIMLIAKA
ncbi:hypothetical protein DHEL01_v203563 [Diaporthe helianthi]|uniref:Uncharacterized protein n=1 Tax=Diaporthe helianthi TaxID=158607 RepID=A0A2P5I6A4_DIAHE|nr:hypothetical protein DHEL01_v203563 [Diaporthe helianthi]